MNRINANNEYKQRYNNKQNVNSNIAFEDKELRQQAHDQGESLIENWLDKRNAQISQVLELFDEEGFPNNPPTATTFSDLYKWTMMPVIRKMQELKGDPIKVTFGIDLRDAEMVKELLASKELQNRVQLALNSLKERKFDREVFEAMLQGPRAGLLTPEDIHAICVGPAGPNNLADDVAPYFEVKTTEELQARPEYQATLQDDDKVRVLFYKNKGMHFIEATGPWHRVTWLETSLMQCVYEAKLRYDLQKKGKSYKQWLYGALLRCAKSVAYTRLVQSQFPDIKPALFTGRRTGGLLFILLQNFFFADHFKQAGSLYNGGIAGSFTQTEALGTSSCDSWFILKSLGLPCLNPSGTHAHELSMVTSILFPRIDKNDHHLPLTQVISHYLYYLLVWKKTGGPMPMLPDTLGTPAFLRAAKYVLVGGKPFLDFINFARQDSGELQDFLDNLKDFVYLSSDGTVKEPIGTMASEIDTSKTLLEAAQLGYSTFGAGGFFGDSEKVWGYPKAPSNSMAVKAMRVMYPNTERIANGEIPYIKIVGDKVLGYPVKLGDPADRREGKLKPGQKLSLDKNLDDATAAAIKVYAETVRVSAAPAAENGPIEDSKEISEILPAIPMSGGRRRRKRKTAKRRRNKRRTTRRRFMR